MSTHEPFEKKHPREGAAAGPDGNAGHFRSKTHQESPDALLPVQERPDFDIIDASGVRHPFDEWISAANRYAASIVMHRDLNADEVVDTFVMTLGERRQRGSTMGVGVERVNQWLNTVLTNTANTLDRQAKSDNGIKWSSSQGAIAAYREACDAFVSVHGRRPTRVEEDTIASAIRDSRSGVRHNFHRVYVERQPVASLDEYMDVTGHDFPNPEVLERPHTNDWKEGIITEYISAVGEYSGRQKTAKEKRIAYEAVAEIFALPPVRENSLSEQDATAIRKALTSCDVVAAATAYLDQDERGSAALDPLWRAFSGTRRVSDIDKQRVCQVLTEHPMYADDITNGVVTRAVTKRSQGNAA